MWLRPEGINSSSRKKEVSVQMEGREDCPGKTRAGNDSKVKRTPAQINVALNVVHLWSLSRTLSKLTDTQFTLQHPRCDVQPSQQHAYKLLHLL